MMITSSFECTHFDGGLDEAGLDMQISYLTADVNVSCTSHEYTSIMLVAVLMMLILPIGCPLMMFIRLFTKRARIEGRQTRQGKGQEDSDLHIGHLAVWVREGRYT